MCDLALYLGHGVYRRALNHESLPTLKEKLFDALTVEWPVGRSVRLDIWVGEPPLVIRGDALEMVTVEPCDEVDWSKLP